MSRTWTAIRPIILNSIHRRRRNTFRREQDIAERLSVKTT